LRDLQEERDKAAAVAYEFGDEDVLAQLLALNQSIAQEEADDLTPRRPRNEGSRTRNARAAASRRRCGSSRVLGLTGRKPRLSSRLPFGAPYELPTSRPLALCPMSLGHWVRQLLAGTSTAPPALPVEVVSPDAPDSSPLVSSALSRERGRTAAAVFLLVSDFRAWIDRRVEYIDFIDDVSVTRRVSIDFAIPEPLADFEEVDERLLPCVPLTFLLKGDVLRNFDLRDGQGNPVPMLTKRQNGSRSGDALIYQAETALEEPLAGDLASLALRLRRVAENPREEAQAELASWYDEALHKTGDHWASLEKLIDRPAFMDLAQTLAENYILFAVVPPEANTRRLMKFGYEEPFKLGEDPDADPDERPPAWERLQVRFGWRVKTVNLAMPAVGSAASFHVEAPAPREMEVEFASLNFKLSPGAVWDVPELEEEGPEAGLEEVADDAASAPELSDAEEYDADDYDEEDYEDVDDGFPADVLDGPRVQRVHLYRAGVAGLFVADALIHLRARRAGFLRAAFFTGWLTFLLLLGGFAYLDDISSSQNSQTAAALLLLGPTFLASSLIRPGEHRLVASVLAGVRGLLAAGVASTVLAVGLLAGAAPCLRCELWLLATVIAGLAAVGLTFSYVLPRPTPVQQLQPPAENKG
jgi:hypothetical protein